MKIDILHDLKANNMTKAELCKRLKLSRPALDAWVQKGEIPDTYGNIITMYFKIFNKPVPNIPNVTGEELASYRRYINLSRPIVADYIGISLSHLNRYENGEIELDVFVKKRLIELYRLSMIKQNKYVGFKRMYGDIVVTEYLFDIEVAASQTQAMANSELNSHLIKSHKYITYNCVLSNYNFTEHKEG